MRFPSLKHLGLAAISVLAGCGQNTSTGPQVIEQGQPPVIIHPTVEGAQAARAAADNGPIQDKHGGGGGVNLAYRGGPVQAAQTIYLIYWGSQWNAGDPSGQRALQQSFFGHAGSTSWSAIDSQYCSGVATGTTQCGSSGTHASGAIVAAGVVTVLDTGSAAPSSPTQSQLAAEAAKIAGQNGGANPNAQYVVNTASGNSQSGFGTQWCAYHSSTSATGGTIAWTYMPYITDAGASCGANFNGLGTTAGITIVGGHEYSETVTDPFPSSGWVDSRGAEIGDKCAWISSGQGASASVNMNGTSFPVQSLWSNAFNSGAGGCVLSYP